ncbi:MAG: YbbR-like domain-containing protein [Desulfovibrio sp.]|nr:YbbR-like domain-containing protein [Desulfovibrio sp.]
MKFSKTRSRMPNVLSLCVALLVAAIMWYAVSVRDRLEAQVEVTIDYHGIPSNLVITEGLINKVAVRLRGPETLLRSFSRQNLTQAVYLSHVKKGTTVVPLSADSFGPLFRAFEIVDIQPTRVVIKADTLIERRVPLHAIMDSPLRGGALTVENVSVTPASVILRGPEGVVAYISSIPLNIMLDPKATGDTVAQTVALDTPSLVTAIPSSVKVEYTITSGRTVVARRCKVVLIADDSREYSVLPVDLTVQMEVPEALSKNSAYLGQLEVSATPPPLEPGQSGKAPLRFRLPEGMTLLNPVVGEVTITRKEN